MGRSVSCSTGESGEWSQTFHTVANLVGVLEAVQVRVHVQPDRLLTESGQQFPGAAVDVIAVGTALEITAPRVVIDIAGETVLATAVRTGAVNKTRTTHDVSSA